MVYFLIPSYNDSENFENLFKNIKVAIFGRNYRILIVDDGSTDATHETVKRLSKKFPVSRIGYPTNRGPGYAFRYGFNHLIPKLTEGDLVVTMEADNTSDFGILPKMMEVAGDFDVVVASPYAFGGKFVAVPIARRVLSFAANWLDSLIFRVKGVGTYSSFYRVYRSSILKKVKDVYGDKFITENGFGVFVEFLVKLNLIGAKIREVPASVDWSRKRGKSKMKIIDSTLEHFSLYIKFLKGRFSPL